MTDNFDNSSERDDDNNRFKDIVEKLQAMISSLDVSSERNLFDLIDVGLSLAYLRRAAGPLAPTDVSPLGRTDSEPRGVIGHCINLLSEMARLDLRRSQEAVTDKLVNYVAHLEKRYETSPQADLNEEEEAELSVFIVSLQYKLDEELRLRKVFTVLPSREIEVNHLLENPEGWFGVTPGMLLRPPEYVLEDFREAARCFTVGFARAAIYFALRATEGTLYQYYMLIARCQPEHSEWGWMLEQLRDKKYCCSQVILEALSKLREKRNEAMHAKDATREGWSDSGASDLIKECRKVITQMSKDLQKRAKSPVILIDFTGLLKTDNSLMGQIERQLKINQNNCKLYHCNLEGVSDNEPLDAQIDARLEQIHLSKDEWWYSPILVNLPLRPSHGNAILAGLYRRTRRLPAILHIKRQDKSKPYELIEIFNADVLSNDGRWQRQDIKPDSIDSLESMANMSDGEL